MELTVVGTSCTWFKRNNSSFVIDDDIILDMPAGSYKFILDYVKSIKEINCIIISHFHSDHFVDLHIPVTHIMRHAKDRKEKLKVYGPKGILDRLVAFNKITDGSKDEIDRNLIAESVDFIEIFDGMEFEASKYKVKVFKMNHIVDSYGFTFSENDLTVGFSIDTAPCDNLDKILESSKYAFVDFAAVEKSQTHICVDEFEEILKKYKNTKIFPIHTCDETQEYAICHGFNYLVDGQKFDFQSKN